MTDKLIDLPENVKKAIDILYAGGFSAYAVGGCVRDSLMGVTPHDWDITTSALPEEIKSTFSDYKTIDTGIKHGTVTVLMEGQPLEITTYRKEGDYSDHRHPDKVDFTHDIRDDLKRRDFTVNAMAYNHIEGFVDIFGGTDDLKRGLIRSVGKAGDRFREDALRIVRGLRFASVLGFEIEEETALAMDELRSDLKFVAAERIADEFRKLICGKSAVAVLRTHPEIIAEFIPEIREMIGCEQRTRYHIYDVWEHTLKALEHSMKLSDDLETKLAVFFHDIGKPRARIYDEVKSCHHFYGHAQISADMTFDILSRLRFDNRTKDIVCRLIRRHDEKVPLSELRVKRLIAAEGEENFMRLLRLMECDNSAKAEFVVNERSSYTEDTMNILRKLKDEDACLSLKTLRIGGHDLIELGARPGKIIGAVLNELLDMVMTGKLENDPIALRNRAKQLIAMYPEDNR